jgi:hypothetical protein
MIFWILGAAALAFLLELWCLDSASKRSYQRGFKDGQASSPSAEQDFMRGVLWILHADDAIEQERKDVLRREYEAELWKRSGAA